MQKFIILLLMAVLVLPVAVFARIGVGIGTGEIKMDKPLKPGAIYELSSLPVRNTGDEPSYYGLGTGYHVERTEIRIPKEWLTFSPDKFYLEPGKTQLVMITLTLPVKAQPGDYFAYVEAFPAAEPGSGGATMGIAVGAKLFFTVVPANILQAVIFRVSSFWARYSPWTWVVFGMVLTAILIVFFKKNFAFRLGVKKK